MFNINYYSSLYVIHEGPIWIEITLWMKFVLDLIKSY